MPELLDEPALPVLTAVVNPSHEAALVGGFARSELGVTVVRRCVDIVELLSAAASGTAQAALVSADLRGLDAESMAHLGRYGLATVGLAAGEEQDRLLHQLGADLVVPVAAEAEQVAGALRAAAARVRDANAAAARGRGSAQVRHPGDAADLADLADVADLVDPSDRLDRGGRVPATEPGALPAGSLLAVWGPTGAPGRTTVALGLADLLALKQRKRSPGGRPAVLLIDGDPYGGSIAILTGLLDEAPGITAACRAANAGTLDVARLADCCTELAPGLWVLTGLTQALRWPELRPAALEGVLALARQLADVTIIDSGFCLEEDEDLSYDTLAPQRNAATLTALRAADRILAVGSADPVGLSRLTRELPRLAAHLAVPLAELRDQLRLLVVANRVRGGLLPGDPTQAAVKALERHAGLTPFATLPMDVTAADAAHGRGQLLSEAAGGSALFLALDRLAQQLGAPSAPPARARKTLRGRPSGRRRTSAGARN